ncbi:autophagocytosis associated protein [Lipomyces orientalis]|uniref:Autophagocytosis associated protein n=1 Tax=Lipomyces orientalis TaxID=1233043 RepID=A0ACC3TQ56_9ASCO
MLRIQSTLSSWREYLSPLSHISTFKQTGEITPDEFVLAGDYLVYKFPTWSWSSAPPSKRRDFLPPDKQFLVTKHVASHVRAQAASGAYAGSTTNDELEDEDGWTISYTSRSNTSPSKSPSLSGPSVVRPSTKSEDDNDSVLDIDDMEANELEDSGYLQNTTADTSCPDHPLTSTVTTSVPDRSYNLYITYSTSYRVPKMYLSGFNAAGGPLSPDEMFEDIVSEYKDKTVTIETAPFLEHTTMVSIHPCRHAGVMKMLLSRAEVRQRRIRSAQKEEERARLGQEDLLAGMDGLGLDSEGWEDVTGNEHEDDREEAIRVDQYLVIFLKFISSVTPGIEHDNTMTAL